MYSSRRDLLEDAPSQSTMGTATPSPNSSVLDLASTPSIDDDESHHRLLNLDSDLDNQAEDSADCIEVFDMSTP